MQRVPLAQLREGSVLAQPVYGERGGLLLKADVTLTERYIESLRSRGVVSVLVHDPAMGSVGDAPPPTDVVSEQVRQTALSTVTRMFELASRATRDLQARPSSEIADALDASAARGGLLGAKLYRQLYQAVENILNEVINADTISGLTSVKTHDNYTFCHSIDVTITALVLARKLYLPTDGLRELGVGCLLHDLGKVLVDRELLTKPGELTAEELAQVRQHPALGYDLLKRDPPEVMGKPAVLARHVVWQHHEWQNGSGYPRGLVSSNKVARTESERHDSQRILLLAEVAAVADVYDALSSDRPYRPALSNEKIVVLLRELRGPHLNAEIVDAFLSVLPVYPQGMDVAVTAGPCTGFRGVVVAVTRRAPDRPRVRLFFDAAGTHIEPLELDLLESAETEITCLVPALALT